MCLLMLNLLSRLVNPNFSWNGRRRGRPIDKAFGVSHVSLIQDSLPLVHNL